jgi:hypothetical protein
LLLVKVKTRLWATGTFTGCDKQIFAKYHVLEEGVDGWKLSQQLDPAASVPEKQSAFLLPQPPARIAAALRAQRESAFDADPHPRTFQTISS